MGMISFEPKKRRELANLLQIYAAMKDIDLYSIDDYFKEDNMHVFKNKLADALIDQICPIGEKIEKNLRKEDMIEEMLAENALKAQERAENVLYEIKKGLKMPINHIH